VLSVVRINKLNYLLMSFNTQYVYLLAMNTFDQTNSTSYSIISIQITPFYKINSRNGYFLFDRNIVKATSVLLITIFNRSCGNSLFPVIFLINSNCPLTLEGKQIKNQLLKSKDFLSREAWSLLINSGDLVSLLLILT
jgi:hypothetical protein